VRRQLQLQLESPWQKRWKNLDHHPNSTTFPPSFQFSTMASSPSHILFECATGCAIFSTHQTEEIGNKTKAVADSIKDLNSFGRMVKLVSFSPFKNALDALQACLDISEG